MEKKNSAAAEMGRARWKKTTLAEREAHSEMMRAKKKPMTPAERKEAASVAAKARWAMNKKTTARKVTE